MIKKILWMICTTIYFLSIWIVFWQQEPDLRDLRIRFCNDASVLEWTKTLSLETDPEQEQDICLYIINSFDQEMNIGVNFVDGIITNDDSWKQACKNEDQKEIFWQHVTFESDLRMTIPGQSVIEKHATVSLPDGYSGKIYGCVTARIYDDTEQESEGVFAVINRLWYPLEILVNGDIVLDMIQQDYTIETPELAISQEIIYLDSHIALIKNTTTGDVSLISTIHNQWNIPQLVTYQWMISYIPFYTWGATDVIEKQDRTLLPGESLTISVPLQNVPWYLGQIKPDFNLSYTPQFNFESDAINDEISQPTIVSFDQSFVLIPWRLLIMIGWWLLLFIVLWILIASKRKQNKIKKKREENAAKVAKKQEKRKKEEKKQAKKAAKKEEKRKKQKQEKEE